jgi:hypothetical protein
MCGTSTSPHLFVYNKGTTGAPTDFAGAWPRSGRRAIDPRAVVADTSMEYALAHSNHDHVHVIAVLDQRLDRDDLREIRDHADETWERERERCRDPLEAELDRTRDGDLEREH